MMNQRLDVVFDLKIEQYVSWRLFELARWYFRAFSSLTSPTDAKDLQQKNEVVGFELEQHKTAAFRRTEAETDKRNLRSGRALFERNRAKIVESDIENK